MGMGDGSSGWETTRALDAVSEVPEVVTFVVIGAWGCWQSCILLVWKNVYFIVEMD